MGAESTPPKARIRALRALKKAGIRTYVFVGPILPETDIEEILAKTVDFTDVFYFDRLRHAKELELEPYTPNRQEIETLVKRFGVKARILF